MSKHVAVLMGGWSAEREVSLSSGEACVKALRELGYKVSQIDVQRDIAEVLAKFKPDVAFNALHGTFGEDGCIQGVLETLAIPYTHSGVLASAVAMDKPMAKTLFAAAGLSCPRGRIVTHLTLADGDPMPRPYVVKPAAEGSSVGVFLVMDEDPRSVDEIVQGDAENWLVEEYIPGREITVAVLGDRPLGVMELCPHSGFYDYENKYTDGKTEHVCPAQLSKDKYEIVMGMAYAAHKTLGCRGLSRADFRYDDTKPEGVFYLLEVNTQPGMTPLSLSPEIAAHAGIGFNELVRLLVEDARLGA